MKKSVIKTVETEVITSYICDVCHREIDDETDHGLELQEMIHINTRGGYSSVFGDMAKIELDICQHCLKEKLGEFIRTTEWHEWS